MQLDHRQDRALFWKVIWLSLFFRTVFATFTPLGVDEVYAIAAAREFSWAFFDHPPLGFWAPVVAAEITGVEHPLIYRAPTLLFGTITTFLIYSIGRELGGSRAGLWAAVLYAIAPAFALAGVFVLPDGPLEMGSAIAVLWLVRITKAQGNAPLGHWVWAGLGLGIALASKYQAGLIPISALVFVAVSPVGRRWFLSPGLYVASVIGLIGLVPVLLWNAENDWASFVFHSGRTGDGLNIGNFAVMGLGQALYLLPPVIFLAFVGIKRGFNKNRPERLLVALIALGPIVGFNIIYLMSESSFPHWTMPGWLFALPLAGMWLAEAGAGGQRRAGMWLSGFGASVLALLLIAMLHLNTGILTRFTHDTPPNWDRTIESFNYKDLLGKLEVRGDLDDVAMIATRGWIEAGAMSTALDGDWPIRVLGENKHHFAYMSGERTTGTALFLDPGILTKADKALVKLQNLAYTFDKSAETLEPIILNRGGIPYIAVNVIRLTIPAQ